MSAGALTGSGGRGGSVTGAAWIAFCNSSIARSSCGSLPASSRRDVLLDDDVGIDAVAFDHVLASVFALANCGTKISPPSISRAPAVDADHAAPGARADQRAELRLLEHVREDVAVGGGRAVAQRGQMAEEGLLRIGAGDVEVARRSRAPSSLRDRRSMTIAETLPPPLSRTSTTRPLLAQLRVVPLDELADAVGAHVGNVQVADLAAAGLGDVVAVALRPRRSRCSGISLSIGLTSTVRAPFSDGRLVDGELHQLARRGAQQAIRDCRARVSGWPLIAIT